MHIIDRQLLNSFFEGAEEPSKQNFMGRDLETGQYVIFTDDNSRRLRLGKVLGVSRERVAVSGLVPLGKMARKKAEHLCIVDSEQAEMFATAEALKQ